MKQPTHFRNLVGARRVRTDELRRLEVELPGICEPGHLGILAVIGQFGAGKTFTCLSAVAKLDIRVVYIQTTQALNHKGLVVRLGKALEPGDWKGTYDALQPDLIELLGERDVLVVLDDAHKLTPTAITELRTLYDDDTTRIALLLVGGPLLESKLLAHGELDDRLAASIYIPVLTDDEAVDAIPLFHSFYEDVEEDLLRFINSRCLGRFRRWAGFTHRAIRACEQAGAAFDFDIAAEVLAAQRGELKEVVLRDAEQAA